MSETPSAASRTDSAPVPGRYRRVLLVEDEPILRTVVARNLTVRGLDVRAVGTVADALVALDGQRPDLVLLDVNLPDRTGWDVMREMRSRGLAVPTIVVSAARADRSRLEEFRPLAYLAKPFDIAALLRLVLGHRDDADAPADDDRGSASP